MTCSLKGELLSPSKLDQTRISNNEAFRLANSCPYHDPIFESALEGGIQGRGLASVERFMEEGPEQQYALVIRADTGRLSTSKGCTCRRGFQESQVKAVPNSGH